MADKKFTIGLSFTADSTQARQEINKLKQDLDKIMTNSTLGKGNNQLVGQAAQLRGILEEATKATGRLDLTKFERSLSKAKLDLNALAQEFYKIDGGSFFNNLAVQVMQADTKVTILSGHLKKFAQGLSNTLMWTLQSNAIHAVQSALTGAWNYAQKLNKGLTDIAIVSDLNTKQLTEFARTANQMAKDLSSNTSDVVSGALIYYQAGLSDEEVIKRTETTIKLAQTSGESAEQISSYMTAIWNNFYDGSRSVEYYADAISYLGAVTAASNADIAEGMQSFAATAETVGLSFEYGASALTVLRDVTQQSASTIGNSLKTIFARLSSLKQGESLEDGVDLTKYSQALANVGVQVLDTNGELKNMDDILDSLALRWQTLGDAEKVALAQTVGGVRQYNNLISLMDNYERFQELVSGSKGSAGYLQSQADEYAESWEAAKNRLTAAWQGIYDQLIDDKFFIKLTNFITWLVKGLGQIIQGMGGLKGVLAAITTAVTSFNTDGLINKLKNVADTLLLIKDTLSGMQFQNNMNAQMTVLDSALSASVQTNDTGVLQYYDKVQENIRKVIQLRGEGDTQGAATLQALTERQIAFLNSLTATADYQERLNNLIQELGAVTDVSDKELEDMLKTMSDIGKSDFIRKNVTNAQSAQKVLGSLNLDSNSQLYQQLNRLTKDDAWANGGGLASRIKDKIGQDAAEAVGAIKTEIDAAIANTGNEEAVNKLLETFKGDVPNSIAAVKNEVASLIATENGATTSAEAFVAQILNLVKAGDGVDELKKYLEQLQGTIHKLGNDTKSVDFAAQFTQITRLASSMMQMSSAIDGVFDSVETGNLTLGQAIGALGSLAMGFSMATKALESFKIEQATANIYVAAFIALVLAVRGIISVLEAEGRILKETTQETLKSSQANLDLINTTDELSDSISDLVDEYQKLNQANENTFETTEKLKELVPQLIDEYRDLAKSLGDASIAVLANDLQVLLDTENWEALKAKIVEIKAILNGAQVDNAQSNLQASRNQIATAGLDATGDAHIRNQTYTWSPTNLWRFSQIHDKDVDKLDADSPLRQFMTTKTAQGGRTYGFSAGLEDIVEYYEALQAASTQLKEDGETDNNLYKGINDQIAAMANAYDEYVKNRKQDTNILAADYEANNKQAISGMREYIAERDQIRQDIADEYGFELANEADQADIDNKFLRAYDEEKLYQAWLNQGAGPDVLEKLSAWYDSLPEDDKTLAIRVAINPNDLSDLSEKLKEVKENLLIEWANNEVGQAGFEVDDEFKSLKESIKDSSDELEQLSENVKQDEAALIQVAKAVKQTERGYASLAKKWSDWKAAIKQGKDEDFAGYTEALTGIVDSLADIMNVSDELAASGMQLGDIFRDYVAENLDVVQSALEGDTDAILQLQEVATQDTLYQLAQKNAEALNITEDKFWELANVAGQAWDDIRSMLEDGQLRVGDNIDDGPLVDALNHIINSVATTEAEAEKILADMGFDAEVEMQKEGEVARSEYPVPAEYTTDTLQTGAGPWTFPVLSRRPRMETEETATEVVAPALKIKTAKYVGGGNITSRKGGTSAGKGRTASKGGGGGSSKTKTKEPDRYHEITSQLEQTSHALDMVNSAEKTAYGPDRLALMDEKIKLLEQETDQYRQLYDEAKGYYDLDKANLVNNYGAQFNADGSIANYDAWYGQFLNKYNSGQMDDDAWKAFEDAIKKYEDSLKHLNDAEKDVQDNLIEIFNQKLEKIEYKLEYVNKLIDKDIEYLDFMIEQLDKSMYSTADVMALLGDRMGKVLEKASNERDAIAGILGEHGLGQDEVQQFLDGQLSIEDVIGKIGQLTADEVKELQDHQTALLNYNKELIKMREESYAKISESISEFNDQIERQIDIVNDASKVMDHYKNIIDIVGKDTLGISDEMLADMDRVSVLAAKSSLEISTDQLKKNKAMLEDLYKQRAEMAETASEEDKRLMDEEIQKQEDEVRRLTESWASSWEEALHVAEEAFKNSIKRATDAFSAAMAGSLGNLENLQEAFDQQKQLNERYLPAYERIYELNKLTRDVTKAIDNTNNVAGKERLLKLQQEILERQESGAEITEYEVGMLQRRLELEQARIALEESQNAKNMVRMTRDNEGNWSYTYTADASKTAEAEQEYEDKLYNLKKFNQESLAEFEEAMWKAVEDYKNSIADMNYTDEERAQRIHEFQQQWIEHNGKMFQMALDDANMIIDEYGGGLDDLQNKWSDTVSGQISDYATLEEVMDNFNTASATLMGSVKGTYDQWKQDYTEIFGAAGTSVKEFAKDAKDAIDETTKKMVGDGEEDEGAVGKAKKFADEMKGQFDGILTHIKTWLTGEDGYFNQIDSIVNKNSNWYNSLQDLITQYGELKKAAEEVPEPKTGAQGDGGTGTAPSTSDSGSGSGSGNTSTPTSGPGNKYTPVWTYTEIRNPGGGMSTYTYGKDSVPDSLKKPGWQWRKLDQKKNPMGDWYYPYGKNWSNNDTSSTKDSALVKNSVKLASGGYTGSWGPEGRMAMLHEKELVLNAKDTENMLAAVGFVRDIAQMLSLNASAMSGGLGMLSSGVIGAGGSYLDQNVTIHAEFPNATNHSEIEEAFNNLIGLASQYAGRKQ